MRLDIFGSYYGHLVFKFEYEFNILLMNKLTHSASLRLTAHVDSRRSISTQTSSYELTIVEVVGSISLATAESTSEYHKLTQTSSRCGYQ